ncbi:MAG: extracellular solute-binding protein [Oscillospiraceae bacterium]|nr:extracellular solute-binding protein [Oscillospiraceae bacterium]
MKRIICIILAASLIITLGACGASTPSAPDATTAGTTAAPATTTAAAAAAATEAATTTTTAAVNTTTTVGAIGNQPQTAGQAATDDGDNQFLLVSEPTTLSYWITIDRTKAAPVLTNYNEIAGYQELERLTGVSIDFIHPAMGQESEQFNIMLASRDFPDMIYSGWSGFPGGPQKAMDDEVILPLNSLLEENCPNFMQRVINVHDIAMTMVTDEGDYFYFPYIHWNQLVVAGWSFLVRYDWLNELGLELPETIDDWDVMLKAFKDMGDMNGNGVDDEYPIINCLDERDMMRWLANAWKTDMDFYHEEGTVKYGPLDDEFGDYLRHMNGWFAAGYIDPEFSVRDLTAYEAKVANGQGAIFLSGLDYGRYLIQMGENAMTGVKYPVLERGTKPIYNNGTLQGAQGAGVAISTTSSDPALAAKWLDFHYHDVGHMLLNFGIEGQSYNIINGVPVFTDEIINNPEGLSVELALVKYSMGGIAEAFFHDPLVRYARFGTFQEQRDTIDRTQDIDLSKKMPATTFTSDESSEYANIMSEINTYKLENWAAFINGSKSIDAEFDTFRSTIRSMGIERAIEIRQAALDRFNMR